jgi:hypothetical protein
VHDPLGHSVTVEVRIFCTVYASCRTVGPFGPAVSEFASLPTGTPESLVVRLAYIGRTL